MLFGAANGSHSVALIQAMLPYLPPPMRPLILQLSIMQELRSLMSFYFGCIRQCDRISPARGRPEPEQLFHELSSFLPREDAAQLKQMMDMFEMMHMLQEFNALNAMEGNYDPGATAGTGNNTSAQTNTDSGFTADILKQFLTKEQAEMLDSYRSLFH